MLTIPRAVTCAPLVHHKSRLISPMWHPQTCYPLLLPIQSLSTFRLIHLPPKHRRAPSAATAATSLAPVAAVRCGWPLWACIALCAAFSQVIEKRTRIGVFLSAPLLATLLGLLATSCKIIPQFSAIYDIIWSHIMPLAASMYLLESDIGQLMNTAGSSILGFLQGALGTIVGTFIAFALVGRHLGPDAAKVAAALCASYIGGSVNFAAVSGLLGLTSGPTLAAAMTADNLAMAGYIFVLMSIPTSTLRPSDVNRTQRLSSKDTLTVPAVTSEGLGLSLAAGLLACALGDWAGSWAGFSAGSLAFTAIFASLLAALVSTGRRRWLASKDAANTSSSVFTGAESLGGALMMLFFVTIGAAAGGFGALRSSGWLLVFIAIQLSVQLSIALALGKMMRIPLPTVLVTANANVGGPSTAAAMAAAKGWKELVQPAVLTGALGYAIANSVGWVIYSYLIKM